MITHPRTPALTLMELLVAIALLSLVSLGVYSLSTFSQHHTTTASRQAEVQNEVSLVLDHMSKHISQAIGNAVSTNPNPPIVVIPVVNPTEIRAFIDTNGNGQSEAGIDHWTDYRLVSNRVQFCGEQCTTDLNCSSTSTSCYQDINGRACITAFTPNYTLGNNYVDVSLTGCWDPAVNCGTLDNPQANMTIRIDLPSVSVH